MQIPLHTAIETTKIVPINGYLYIYENNNWNNNKNIVPN